MDADSLDQILTLQLAVAWAGESKSDPPRLGWWRTGMVDEFGGEDLLRRLTPRTWQWAVLEATREAARRVDRAGRERSDNPDHLVSLFCLGFERDEPLDDRLRELKQQGLPPTEALPGLAALLPDWSASAFADYLAKFGEVTYEATATGRRLAGAPAEDPLALCRALAAALLPCDGAYPLPHYRVAR